MSGNNKVFLYQASSLDAMESFKHISSPLLCVSKEYEALGIEKEWENFNVETTDNSVNQVISKAIDSFQQQETPRVEHKGKGQEIRMQEIEEIILNNATFRNIEGNLCVWNGRYYKQLNSVLFPQAVRKLMPKEEQKLISRFGRFKEAYEYMLANNRLKDQFSKEEEKTSKHMIVFKNGMYDAERDKLISSNDKYPVLFDINANYIGDFAVETPYMDQIINRASKNDAAVLKRFYQCLGYICSQGNEAKKFFVLGTAPDSGKSIIGEFLGKLLGAENVSTISLDNFGGRFALGTINQKVLNYNMDLSAVELDTSVVQRLKQLTGDARIDCEEKYVQGRTVTHHCKFLFATNHPIRLKQDDEAFYRRLVLIPFSYSVDEYEKDYDLQEKIWEERDAIATKAAHEYRKLLRHNFIFEKSDVAESIVNEWRSAGESELIKQFFSQYFEYNPNAYEQFMPTDILFQKYKEFCGNNGKVVLEVDKPQFSKRIRSIFKLTSSKKRVKGYSSPVNGYVGIYAKGE